MTISTTSNSVVGLGNGVNASWSFTFVADSAADIFCYYTDSTGAITLVPTSQYTLFINPPSLGAVWGVGGIVTYPLVGSPIAVGTTFTIQRILPLIQTTTISDQGDFAPVVIESALDTLEMQIQQVSAQEGRAIQIPVVDPQTIITTLPAAAQRASEIVSFDAQGNVITIPAQVGPGGDLSNYTATPVGGTSSQLIKNLFADNIFDLKSLGLTNGSNVNYTDLLTALEECASRGAKINGNGMTVNFASGQFAYSYDSDIFNAKFYCPDNISGFFKPAGSLGTEYTASSIAGDFLSITFASAPPLAVGKCHIRSSDAFAVDGSSTYYLQQWSYIYSITNSGRTINFSAPLDYPFATTILVSQPTMPKLRLENVSFIGNPANSTSSGCFPYLCDRPVLIDCSAQYFAEYCFEISKCYAPYLRNIWGEDGNGSGDRYVIGINDGTEAARIFGAGGRNVRHVVTSGSSTGIGTNQGINRHTQAFGIYGQDMESAVFDQHPPTDLIYANGITASFSANPESYELVTIQGARTIIKDVQCINAIGGMFWQPYTNIANDYCIMECRVGSQQSVGGSQYIFDVENHKSGGSVSFLGLYGGGTALATSGDGIIIKSGAGAASFERIDIDCNIHAANKTILIETVSGGTGDLKNISIKGSYKTDLTAAEGIQLNAGSGAGVIDQVDFDARVIGGQYCVRNIGATSVTVRNPRRLTGFATGAVLNSSGTMSVGPFYGTATYDPPSLTNGSSTSTTLTVTGCALGDIAQASFSISLQGITMTAEVTSANTVTVILTNNSGGTLDIGTGTLTAIASRFQ